MVESIKIEGQQLQDCLEYFEAQSKVVAFQVKEAELFDSTEITGDNYIETMYKAAKRRSQAANEVLRRHQAIKSVPSAALQVHRAWYDTIIANQAWASAYAEAFEAMANGKRADLVRIQQLEEECQRKMKSADEEERNFVKRLVISNNYIDEMSVRITAEIRNSDPWEPTL